MRTNMFIGLLVAVLGMVLVSGEVRGEVRFKEGYPVFTPEGTVDESGVRYLTVKPGDKITIEAPIETDIPEGADYPELCLGSAPPIQPPYKYSELEPFWGIAMDGYNWLFDNNAASDRLGKSSDLNSKPRIITFSTEGWPDGTYQFNLSAVQIPWTNAGGAGFATAGIASVSFVLKVDSGVSQDDAGAGAVGPGTPPASRPPAACAPVSCLLGPSSRPTAER